MRSFLFTLLKSTVAAYLWLMLCANAAQPGIWNAGGSGFNLLFPEDSTAFQKIRMQSEAIHIQLYPGFAIVKGTYQLYNTSTDTLDIKIGYPVEGIYDPDGRERNEITFDGLYQLRVLQDGQPRSILQEPIRETLPGVQTFDNNNWYVWESRFLPQAVSELTVYFMMNTNEAKITEGYARDQHNVLIYLLESGRIWQQPIGSAEFRVQMRDGLTIDDVHGISRHIDFSIDPERQLLVGHKESFTPMPADNLVINYGRQVRHFDFAAFTANSEDYFNAIDSLSILPREAMGLEEYTEQDPYLVQQISVLSWLVALLFIGLPLLLMLGVGFLTYRWLRRR